MEWGIIRSVLLFVGLFHSCKKISLLLYLNILSGVMKFKLKLKICSVHGSHKHELVQWPIVFELTSSCTTLHKSETAQPGGVRKWASDAEQHKYYTSGLHH